MVTGKEEELGDVNQRIQSSSYKIDKFQESNAQHGDYTVFCS